MGGEMHSVELYNRVRRACHVEGMSKREASRLFEIDHKTILKTLEHAVPPRYRRSKSPVRPKLDPFIPVIDQILEDDKSKSKKQRHTAKPIHDRLRDEHGFTDWITIVTDYVREKKRRSKEVFVPLSHARGHAQVDFGETLGVIGGTECKLQYFVIVLPHSDAIFAKAYPAETAEAFCDGHIDKGRDLCNRLNMIQRAVSQGDAETLIQHPASMTTRHIRPKNAPPMRSVTAWCVCRLAWKMQAISCPI